MLKKLSDEKLNELPECGISKFAEHGMSAGILENNGHVTEQLLKFIASVFTFEQADIIHRNGE